jgi:peptidoglycan/xylan/chitin deacetylase (PgdA/CDA1 family)
MLLVLLLIAGAAQIGGGSSAAKPPLREVAVTVDDLPTASVITQSLDTDEEVTRGLLAAIRRHAVPAIGFVNEAKLQREGRVEERRVALLKQWLDAGLELGNHTRSHLDLHHTSLADYQADLLRGEAITRPLADAAGRRYRYFRHPYLHTGRSQDVRDGLDVFLQQHGYRIAPVSIDNYDYIFAAAFDRAEARRDAEAVKTIVSTYLDYMESVVEFYEGQSRLIVGREIRQILLIHANALNARTFDALATRLTRRGYAFVTLDRALEDPAYAEQPDSYFGPAGITWLHRWALTRKLPGKIFAGEPEVPVWIADAANASR